MSKASLQETTRSNRSTAATIKDVARVAGVSVATVSRVVNGIGSHRRDTEQLVNRVISQLDYQPNVVARSLVMDRSKALGVMVPSVTGGVTTELLRGINLRAHQLGLAVLLCDTDSEGIRTPEYLRVLSERRVDGIIIAHEQILSDYEEALHSLKIPVILISTKADSLETPYIKVDDRVAAFDATEYLIHQGHSDIACIAADPADPIAGAPRIEGYRDALEKHRIPFRSELLIPGKFSFECGASAARRLFDLGVNVTAIFAVSDEAALGVISAAYTTGRRIPQDLSLIGYDDTRSAIMSTPPLTTVHQPLFEMGVAAVDGLIGMAYHGEAGSCRVVPHTIVERASVATMVVDRVASTVLG